MGATAKRSKRSRENGKSEGTGRAVVSGEKRGERWCVENGDEGKISQRLMGGGER